MWGSGNRLINWKHVQITQVTLLLFREIAVKTMRDNIKSKNRVPAGQRDEPRPGVVRARCAAAKAAEKRRTPNTGVSSVGRWHSKFLL